MTLGPGGWVSVPELLGALNRSGRAWSRDELNELVSNNDKKRFSFSSDGTKVRANQGHSVEVDLQLCELEPPEVLFHGTVERFLHSIMQKGLQSMERHHVHLSEDYETAHTVGQRRGTPMILKIWASAMQLEGYRFYRSDNGVWLTESVPAHFLELIPERDPPCHS